LTVRSPHTISSDAVASSSYPSVDALVHRAFQHHEEWAGSWGAFDRHEAVGIDPERLDRAFDAYLDRLEDHYPFHHPRYAGQMLKPPHPVAVAAYAAAMRINPNNHALDGGPGTSDLEQEVVADLAEMMGFPAETLGHLTSSGTIANLEALWVARESHPDQGIAFSADAHYTHERMCGVLDLPSTTVDTDAKGRIDLQDLERVLETESIGTVVLTAGTTGLGSVDRIDRAVDLCRAHDARIHVDAAYGGFFRLLADAAAPSLDGFPAESFRAIAACDSVVVDPHKHGLQPYGCGAVLFRDPAVGRFYKHDSPYTYFTSDELHLGEITLECSRSGAAAGALWCTLQALPLSPTDGIGEIVAATHRAARRWADAIETADALTLFSRPETDIVTYFPRPAEPTLSALDRASQALFDAAMNDPDDPVFTSVLRLPADAITTLHPELEADRDAAAVVRSVVMKPEHETYADDLVATLDAHARRIAETDPTS
jgi:glutamate/tyrosine decarboxylase-like PLP-dependent enzyme